MIKRIKKYYRNRSWFRTRTITRKGILYMWRLQIIRTPFLIIYINKTLISDQANRAHDHPGPSLSVPLRGQARESFYGNFENKREYQRGTIPVSRPPRTLKPLRLYYRNRHVLHRLDAVISPYISLFIGWNWRHKWRDIDITTGKVCAEDEGFARTARHYAKDYGSN